MLLSLDAIKAFNRVSWLYLIQTLKHSRLVPNFIRWLQVLYSNPQSAVKVTGFVSDPFTLQHGCRQGCTLLFDIRFEPLTQLIRGNSNIKGCTINGEQHNISVYADDVLLYLTNLLEHLKDLFLMCGYFSGYIDKTMAMEIGGKISGTVVKWSLDGIKYLGIRIPPSLDKLYDVNYKILIQNISEDLGGWSTLSLSLLGVHSKRTHGCAT